jgi:ATP-dependent Lon protease
LKEVPQHIRKGLEFRFVERIGEVLKETLK